MSDNPSTLKAQADAAKLVNAHMRIKELEQGVSDIGDLVIIHRYGDALRRARELLAPKIATNPKQPPDGERGVA